MLGCLACPARRLTQPAMLAHDPAHLIQEARQLWRAVRSFEPLVVVADVSGMASHLSRLCSLRTPYSQRGTGLHASTRGPAAWGSSLLPY